VSEASPTAKSGAQFILSKAIHEAPHSGLGSTCRPAPSHTHLELAKIFRPIHVGAWLQNRANESAAKKAIERIAKSK